MLDFRELTFVHHQNPNYSHCHCRKGWQNWFDRPGIDLRMKIDTGAAHTVIGEKVARALDLVPTGVCTINTPSSTDMHCNEYLVRIEFPNNVTWEGMVVGIPEDAQPQQLTLLGRDILSQGVLILIGYKNSFSLSF